MDESRDAAPHDHAATERAADAHGHGGHAGMSMEAMVRDMRNRFVVAIGTGWVHSFAATFWIAGDVALGSDTALAQIVKPVQEARDA